MFPSKDLSLEQFQEKFPDLHAKMQESLSVKIRDSISTEQSTEQASKLSNLEDALKKEQRINKITSACIKAGKLEMSEELISSEKSVEDCYLEMLSSNSQTNSNTGGSNLFKKVFEQTAPPSAGSDKELPQLNTYSEACAFVANRDGLTKKNEIARKVREEFPEVIGK